MDVIRLNLWLIPLIAVTSSNTTASVSWYGKLTASSTDCCRLLSTRTQRNILASRTSRLNYRGRYPAYLSDLCLQTRGGHSDERGHSTKRNPEVWAETGEQFFPWLCVPAGFLSVGRHLSKFTYDAFRRVCMVVVFRHWCIRIFSNSSDCNRIACDSRWMAVLPSLSKLPRLHSCCCQTKQTIRVQ